MNVLAALLVLALAHDPRAFKMPKKAKTASELPVAGDRLPAAEPAPVAPAPPAPVPEPAPEPEKPQPKPIMFEMPKSAPNAEPAPATGNRPPATPKHTRKKKPIPPRSFQLPKKNVSN